MPGGMQRNRRCAELHALAIFQRVGMRVAAEPMARDRHPRFGKQIFLVASSQVIAVRVRDHGSVHRPPGIDVEIARRTVQAVLGNGDQRWR